MIRSSRSAVRGARTRIRLLPLLAVLALAGCHHLVLHRPRNAPGRSDVRTPPTEIAREGLERPDDPGERMLVLSGGGFGGGGYRGGGGRDGRGVYGAGVELSLLLGDTPRSHARDDFFIYPVRALGLNFGWTLAEREGGGVGPLYLELQASYLLFGVAAGYAVDADDGLHGFQGTLFMGPIYARVSAFGGGRGTDIQLGAILKLPVVWVWSR
jgi:hypothetical protein